MTRANRGAMCMNGCGRPAARGSVFHAQKCAVIYAENMWIPAPEGQWWWCRRCQEWTDVDQPHHDEMHHAAAS